MDISTSEVEKMTLDIFLGLSTGHWVPTHLPTRENPVLSIQYVGNKGKPFKLLYAAVRPSTPKLIKCSCGESLKPYPTTTPLSRTGVKPMRPTLYFNEYHINLANQTILFSGLKDSIPDEVLTNLKRRGHKLPVENNDTDYVLDVLMKDIEDCKTQAIAILSARKAEHVSKPVDPRNKIRRLAVKLLKAIHQDPNPPSEEEVNKIIDNCV